MNNTNEVNSERNNSPKSSNISVKIALSIILVIIAFIGLFNTNSFVVRVGAGTGKGEKITTLEEFNAVLDFISSKNQTSLASDINHLSNITDYPSSIQPSSLKSYNSVTCVEDGVVEKDGYKLKRVLKMYFTQIATYYESSGTLQYISSSNPDDNYYYSFNVEIYIDLTVALIKFNQNSFMGETIKTEYVNKWLEIPYEEAFDAIEYIDNLNRDALSYLNGYLHKKIEDGYKLNGKKFSEITSSITGYDTEVNVSFSDPQNPNVEILGSFEDMNVFSSMTFSNIDNTVIKANTGKAMEIDSLINILNISEDDY